MSGKAGAFKQTSEKFHRILSKPLTYAWLCQFGASQILPRSQARFLGDGISTALRLSAAVANTCCQAIEFCNRITQRKKLGFSMTAKTLRKRTFSLVQVGYTQVVPSVVPPAVPWGAPPQPPAYHTFVVTTDPNGSVNVFHAYPQNYPIPTGPLTAAFGAPDASNTPAGHVLTTVYDDGKPCTCENGVLGQDANNINNANIPYWAFGPNSNSAVNYALQTLGIHFTPSLNTPGWNTQLPLK